MPKVDLAPLLRRLDAELRDKRPRVFASLRPGVGAKPLAKLGRHTGGSVPPEIASWFAWHDGQRAPTGKDESLDGRFFLHSLDTAIETYEAFSDPDGGARKPWKQTWLPLLDNGAGDHLVFDRSTGAMIEYHHDANDRPRRAPTLAAYVSTLADRLAAERAASGLAIELTAMPWEPVGRPPTEAQLEKARIGTAYTYWEEVLVAIRQPMARRHVLFVKTDRDRWLYCSGTDLAVALASWRELARRPPAPDSGYWKRTWDVWYAVKEHRANTQVAQAATR
jgi:cell wall assembly regulator SMI1